MTGRPWSWITGRPRTVDGVVVGITLLAAAASALGTTRQPAALAVLLVLAVVQAVALWWRRRYATAVLVIAVLAGVGAIFVAPDRDPSDPALIFTAYAVSVYAGRSSRLAVAGIAIVIVLIGIALLFGNQFDTTRKLLPAGVTVLVAWVIGDFVRSRRRVLANLVARHRQEREQAAEEERLRIARELHDVVAHNVSLIAIQAGAARVSGNSSADALKSIESTARDTLAELNRLLGVLRKDPAGAARAPQPGLAQVDALLQPAREAGLDVTVKVSGDTRPLPAALDLSAYRIVQEAMTNVLKHAQASRVEVGIDYKPDALVLTISDNGAGARSTTAASSGHGLIGMRERVDLFGGDLNTASSSLGGFTVRATLPVKT